MKIPSKLLEKIELSEEPYIDRVDGSLCKRTQNEKGKKGGEIILSNGEKIIIPQIYKKLEFIFNGTIRISKDGINRGLLNSKGEIIKEAKGGISLNDLKEKGKEILQNLSDEELNELKELAINSKESDKNKLATIIILEEMRRNNMRRQEQHEMQTERNKQKENQITQSNELKEELLKDEENNEIKYEENIDVDYANRNMSQEVKEYLSRPNAPKPKNKIELDGQEIFITDLMEVDGGKGFLGFAKRGGKYCMNYYIKSNSEGLRRCKPGNKDGDGNGGIIIKMHEFNGLSPQLKQRLKDQGFNYTKNFSYERTTMVDFRIQEILDKKYHSKSEQNNSENMTYYTPGDLITGLREHSKEKVQRFIDMSKEIDVEKDFSDIGFGKMSENKLEDVKEFYKNETFGIDVETLKISTDKKYKYNHDYLGIINVDVLEGKMEGEDIEIFFSSTEDEPEKVRIDQIQYKDQKINSYGIASKQINGGLLTAKPIEYDHQTPKEYWKSYFETGEGKRYGGYIDIRPIYQGSPIIKKYKELKKTV